MTAAGFTAAVLTDLRRRILGPLPADPPGAVFVRRLALAGDAEPGSVTFEIDVIVWGVPVRERFPVPEWGRLAVGSPSALAGALAAEIRLHVGERLLGARAAGPIHP